MYIYKEKKIYLKHFIMNIYFSFDKLVEGLLSMGHTLYSFSVFNFFLHEITLHFNMFNMLSCLTKSEPTNWMISSKHKKNTNT